MFCVKCGQLLPEGSSFCSKCGTPISFVNEKRNESIEPAQFNDITPSESEDIADVISKINQSMPYYENIQQQIDKISRLERKRTLTLTAPISIIWGMLRFAVLGTILMFASIPLMLLFSPLLDKDSLSIIAFLLFSIAGIYGLFGRYINSYIMGRKLNTLYKNLADYAANNATPESFVLAPDYRCSSAANYIKNCLINKMASSLGEAYNLYNNHLYQNNTTSQLNSISLQLWNGVNVNW
ncbi:zinc ribbon domain-containing protein [Pseudobutyrivibrio ruminis]|uniref:Zinc-ribbon domain-containing protein n=1 Tax=Pseudobutyrivibrio ruminis TaxID=46206 RepID=A0A2G3DX97_9FIRM|nr:zinc ribbon domain-containing protein [Pseudobutyrivibrio ruminis]PHU35490.1 hypothetical protein CSX01_05070 [Pseudobutyrivibrio ruminis]